MPKFNRITVVMSAEQLAACDAVIESLGFKSRALFGKKAVADAVRDMGGIDWPADPVKEEGDDE